MDISNIEIINTDLEEKLIFHFFEGVVSVEDRIDIGTIHYHKDSIEVDFYVNWKYHSTVDLPHSELLEYVEEAA